MRNHLTYSELSDICNEKKISLSKLAECANMTLRGFREAFNRNSVSAHTAASICQTLGITPNQFFGWEDGVKKQQIQNGGIGNTQQMDTYAVGVLRQQIATKDEQIREKDAQISQLLKLLTK